MFFLALRFFDDTFFYTCIFTFLCTIIHTSLTHSLSLCRRPDDIVYKLHIENALLSVSPTAVNSIEP